MKKKFFVSEGGLFLSYINGRLSFFTTVNFFWKEICPGRLMLGIYGGTNGDCIFSLLRAQSGGKRND